MDSPAPSAAPEVTRWMSYDSTGFVVMPWRLGSVLAPCGEPGDSPLPPGRRESEAVQRLIALELVGATGVVRQVARALRAGQRVTLHSSDRHSRARWLPWAPGGVVPFYKRLPSGPVHALFLHPQAIPGELDPRKPVYCVARTEDLGHAYRMLNTALPIPILPAWTSWLIARAQEMPANLVRLLIGDGLWGLELVPDTAGWAALVREGLTQGALSWAA